MIDQREEDRRYFEIYPKEGIRGASARLIKILQKYQFRTGLNEIQHECLNDAVVSLKKLEESLK